MDAKKSRALLAVLLAAAAAVQMARLAARAASSFDRRYYCGERQDRSVEAGHALLHGVPHELVFRSMPAGAVAGALMCRQDRPAAVLAAPAAAFALSGLLVFALGAALGGALSGAAALALFAATASPFDDRWLLTPCVLLAAWLAVRGARRPSTRRTVLLASAVGLSLSVLSALFLLPAVLAFRERRSPRAAALLLLTPLLFLAPWTYASWKATGRPLLLEDGRADANVVAGALGLERTAGPGSPREAAGLPPGRGVLAWAAGEAARHPLRYAAAVGGRLRYAASLRPLLFAAALLALWIFRSRPGHAALGTVALYFLGAHALMAVEERYFTPLWPLAAALAGSLAGLGGEEPEKGAAWPGALAFVPLAALAAFAHALTLAYPARSADPGAWTRELARAPDAWLLAAEGRRLLRAGKPAQAEAALARSLDLRPELETVQLLGWARLERGGAAEELPALAPELLEREFVMRALAHAKAGRRTPAEAALVRAADLAARRSASWGGRAGAAARDALGSTARELLEYWPAADRVRILAGLAALPGTPLRTAEEEAYEAFRRARTLPRAQALDALVYVEKLAPGSEGLMRGAAAEYSRLGEPARAAGALARLAAARPADLLLRLDLARLARTAGREDLVRRALAEAGRLAASPERTRRLAEAHRDLGDARRAVRLLAGLDAPEDLAERARLHLSLGEHAESLRLLDELVRREPGVARWRNDRGVSLLLLGRREAAAEELRAALGRDPGLLTAALSLGTLLSSTGRTPEALEVYDRALAAGGDRDPATRERILAERRAGARP